jgi:hypothetical protein
VARRLALLGLAAAVVVAGCSGDDGDDADAQAPARRTTTTVRTLARDGSEVVDATGALAAAEPLAAFRIEYRVENYAGGDNIVTTDELIVRRPFDSRLNAKAGPPPGAEVQSTTVSSFGKFESGSANSVAFATSVRPGVPSGDIRFDSALDALVGEGLFERRERRRVIGRECQIYRTGEPVGTGRLTAPRAGEYADECIDATGLVLEEVWVTNGQPIRRKLAVTLDTQPQLDDGLFTLNAAPLPLETRGAAVIELTADSRPPATFWELDQPPAGFTHRGRYRVLTASPQAAPGAPQTLDSDTVVDVYVSGPRLLLIEQAAVAEPGNAEEGPGRAVDAGQLGRGRVTAGVLGSTVVAYPDAARVVRVEGTLTPDELVRITASLRAKPAGTLTPKSP